MALYHIIIYNECLALQEIRFTAAELEKGEPTTLKLVKFANTSILTIFIESNQEDEETTKVCSDSAAKPFCVDMQGMHVIEQGG